MPATRKILSLASRLLLAAALVFLAACSQPESDAIRFGLASPVLNLDPRFATDAASERVNRLLYQRLVDFDEQFRPEPAVANWEVLAPLHYRFRLNGGEGQFAAGERLRAQDVAATYASILDPATASPHRISLSMIERIEVVDARTVDFVLSRPDSLFPGYLTIGILPEAFVQSGTRAVRTAQGSGDFQLLEWPEENRVILQRRRDKQVIDFLHVPDATVRVLKLLRGEVDIIQNDLPRELIQYLSRQKGISLLQRDGTNFTYLGFNLQDPVTTHAEIRTAIAHAIDRESIVQHLFGPETKMAESILVPDHWAGAPGLAPFAHDPDKARRILERLGYDRQHPLELEYKTTTDPFRVRIATIVQQQLQQVGVKVTIRSYDWGTFYRDIKAGQFQMYSLTWVGIKSPDIFRYVFHSASLPPDGANRGRYRNLELDRSIERLEGLQDLQARVPYYRHIQEHVHADLPYVPLWYEEHFAAMRATISGYKLARDGNLDGLRTIQKVKRKQ